MLKVFNFDANACFGIPEQVSSRLKQEIGSELLNPSAVHQGGQVSRAKLERARESLMKMLRLNPTDFELIFTSGATEGNNWVLSSLLTELKAGKELEIAVSAHEHPAVLVTAEYLASQGAKLVVLPVLASGRVDLEAAKDLLSANTSLVSLMAVNNETGVFQDFSSCLGTLRAAAPNAIFHSDAVQVPGKLQCDLAGFDCLTLSGHKFGALTGIGALVKRRSMRLSPMLLGGPQETHKRAGTENLLGAISMGFAAEWILENEDSLQARYHKARQALVKRLEQASFEWELNAELSSSVSNTLNISISGLRTDDLVVALDLEGILVSSGAACASGKPGSSGVLRAMGFSAERARRSLRISFSGTHDEQELLSGVERLVESLERYAGGSSGRALNA